MFMCISITNINVIDIAVAIITITVVYVWFWTKAIITNVSSSTTTSNIGETTRCFCFFCCYCCGRIGVNAVGDVGSSLSGLFDRTDDDVLDGGYNAEEYGGADEG